MPEISVEQLNWAAGELSPKMRSRSDIPSYKNGAERIVNFISETAGPSRFRSGFVYAQNTRRHNAGWLLPFQFNDSDAYEMEFTEGYNRFFRNSGIITLAAETISGASVAVGVVTLTITSHGYSNGDEIIVNNVVGMVQLNNRSFVVTNATTNTVDLLDSFGSALDGSGFSAYVSGGSSNKIYEAASPYRIVDIPHLKIAQNADVLYIDHPNYEPMKLTRYGDNNWAMSTYFRNGDPCLKQLNITGVSLANPCQITVPNHGLATGQQVYISGLADSMENTAGFPNGPGAPFDGSTAYVITVTGPDTFTIPVDTSSTTNYTAYSGGGAVHIYLPITAITKANPAKVTVLNHGFSTGDQIIINGVVGMTELNNAIGGSVFTITKVDANSFTLNGVDSSAYTAWSSGGYVLDKTLLLGCVAFYQGRCYHAYSDFYPESLWGSLPLDDYGNPQYDNFNMGTYAADAFKFTLSPISQKVDKIQSLVATLNFLAICTFEGISKADGGSAGDPISPSNIFVSPVVTAGCIQQITPVLLGIVMLYIHRSGLILESLEYDIFYNAYNAMDKNLTNDHWTQSGIIQMVYFVNRPTGFWFVRNDGILVFLSYMVKETINAAARMLPGGILAKFLSVGAMPRANQYDQCWVITERMINGKTHRFVEYQADDPIMPEKDDYWTGDANAVADDLQWRNAMFEAQKQYIYVDAALTYDGSIYGTNAGATLTPAAVSGNSVIFTASAPVFTADMVGQQLWKQSQNGVGTGRAVILSYTNSTHVVCQIISAFDSVSAMPAGQWYLTTQSVGGAWHLEGETVRIITDGGEHPEQKVVNGSVPLEYPASVVHLGEGYNGLTRSMHIISGSPAVPCEGRKMNVNRLSVKFLNTLGARYGTNLYNMTDFQFASPTDLTDRPSPCFSEHLVVPMEDDTNYNKHIYIQQVRPLPCTIEEIVPFVEFDEQ